MVPLHWLSAADIAKSVANRSISPVELMRYVLERIGRCNADLHVFPTLDADAAMKSAVQSEKEIMEGRRLGPLHGVPVAIKDVIDVRGVPTTCYSKIMLDHVAADDAPVVAKLRRAGAIILGKTATHEFAIGGPSFDLPFPPARHPWNIDYHPGGSSTGSAVGVAAGLFPIALGTDTGGSIRNPAGGCGIIGIKPTYDLVPRRGVFPLAFTLDHVGPMCRTVADAALVLDAITGPRPGKSSLAPQSFGAELAAGMRRVRVGFVRHFHETDIPADAEVGQAIENVVTVLAREGAEICDVTLPSLNEYMATSRIIYMAEAWSIHEPWMRARPGDYGSLSRQRLLGGAFLSASDYVNATRRRRLLTIETDHVLKSVDVLVTANSMDPSARIDRPDDLARTYPRQARAPFNVTGHPAMVMMAGLSRDGLPLSFQLAAPYWREATMLRVAAAFERATEWHTRRPPKFA